MSNIKFHNLYEFEKKYESKLPLTVIRGIWKRNARGRDLPLGITEYTAAAGLSGLAGNLLVDAAFGGSVKGTIGAIGCWIGAFAIISRGGDHLRQGLYMKQFDDDGDANFVARGSRWVTRKSDKEAHLLVTLRDLAKILVTPEKTAARDVENNVRQYWTRLDPI